MTPVKLTHEQTKKVKVARASRHLVFIKSGGSEIGFAPMKRRGKKKGGRK